MGIQGISNSMPVYNNVAIQRAQTDPADVQQRAAETVQEKLVSVPANILLAQFPKVSFGGKYNYSGEYMPQHYNEDGSPQPAIETYKCGLSKAIRDFIKKEDYLSAIEAEIELASICKAQEKELVVPTLEEFMDADPYQYFWLETYDQVVRYYEIQNEKIDQDKQIVEYAIEHNVPHGIVEASESYDYVEPTSQTYMDYGLYLAFAVIILLTICYAGTISNEHKMGTVKLLYTRKATRFEVITAKLIYVIMNLYVLWIIASVIFFFLVGSQYGFADLFGSKIITLFGNTMSVPYLLWYFVSMLICSLPLLFYVAVLVLCSAFIPTTAVTSVLMTVGTIFFSIIWILINLMWSVDISAVAFLPFSYIEYAFTHFKSSFYMYSVARTGVPMGSYGLVVSLVCAVLVFIATIIFYQKKDIKN